MRKLATFLLLASLACMIAGCERSLIYYPSKVPEAQLREMAQAQGLEPWLDPEGARIGWADLAEAPKADRSAIVVFHGNAGHAANRAYFAHGFAAATSDSPWDVFLFEYPGYGSRPGQPSEAAIKAAARAGIEPLIEQGYGSVFLVGESLGSGVACHLAAAFTDQIKGVFLVTPFTSLTDVGRRHYPGFLVALLLSERYDNVEALSRYDGRVATLLAERDEVVPADLGRALHESYAGSKRLWVQAGRTHNTLSFDPEERWWSEVAEFLQTE